MSTSPDRLSKADKILLAQLRMEAKQSGIHMRSLGSDEDMTNDDVDENFIPDSFKK